MAAMHWLEITELAARIRDRTISPLTATRAQLERIAAALVRAGVAFQSITSWHRRHPLP